MLRLCVSAGHEPTLHTLFPTLPRDKFRARFPRAHTKNPARTITVSFLRTRTLSDAGALDRRLYSSPHSLRKTGTVKPARNSFHGCKLLSVVRRPLDIQARLAYQRSLVNTYFFLGLRRPRSRNSADRPSRCASVNTRSCAARLQHTTFCMSSPDVHLPHASGTRW
jgi:hypothetical protein